MFIVVIMEDSHNKACSDSFVGGYVMPRLDNTDDWRKQIKRVPLVQSETQKLSTEAREEK